MKLKKSKGKKTLKIIAIILAVILVITLIAVIAGVIVYNQMDKKISNIYISSYPEKRYYYVGEELDISGLEIHAVTEVGTILTVNSGELTISGFDSSEVSEKQWVTITYEGLSVQYDIAIIELPKPTPTVESIEVYNLQTEYDIEYWNEYGLNIVGSMIRLHYSDGSTVEDYLYPEYVSGVRKVDAPETIKITVSYPNSGTPIETQVEITITE